MAQSLPASQRVSDLPETQQQSHRPADDAMLSAAKTVARRANSRRSPAVEAVPNADDEHTSPPPVPQSAALPAATALNSSPVKRHVDRKRLREDDAHANDTTTPPSNSICLTELDDYRNECLKLEKVRHARVYEADKRRLYHENVILTMYEMEVAAIIDEFEQAKRSVVLKMLSDNAEKMRQVEELRYGICKDDVVGAWQRKHEMSLRGRGGADDDLDEGRSHGRRKRTRSSSVKVNVELDDHQVSDDLAEMRGEKRQREDGNDRERRSKKRR
ncbi:hypothetical protein BWQ96_03716 [Gracilariopsis chorda]|uniref:Uncharacterized protein n=1 Tax=Gracilariopsis chorda TaxID=448386 RepID=A0A2V3IWJ7_9FLOR|nr:hypothetical protein BWQ96_03716 [Gracilariopsis chorda]|eukprot:PXF46481.1 hypothetical protein BWQ96_03716 [Gracilariopsis chorda]